MEKKEHLQVRKGQESCNIKKPSGHHGRVLRKAPPAMILSIFKFEMISPCYPGITRAKFRYTLCWPTCPRGLSALWYTGGQFPNYEFCSSWENFPSFWKCLKPPKNSHILLAYTKGNPIFPYITWAGLCFKTLSLKGRKLLSR